jgi:hypothetical protein
MASTSSPYDCDTHQKACYQIAAVGAEKKSKGTSTRIRTGREILMYCVVMNKNQYNGWRITSWKIGK